jgi:Cu-Zn family superoxide dismutase
MAAVLAASPSDAARVQKAAAKLIALDGSQTGTAQFTATHHGILIDLKLHGLPPGVHGVHIHTSANCNTKAGFTNAGPHFSPEPKPHGFMAKGGMHAGDLPNIYAAADGTVQAALLSNAFALGNGKKSIFDKDGASIIVTANGDDYASQPDGRSGNRIACGVIVRTVGPASRARFAKKKKKH